MNLRQEFSFLPDFNIFSDLFWCTKSAKNILIYKKVFFCLKTFFKFLGDIFVSTLIDDFFRLQIFEDGWVLFFFRKISF